MRRTRLSMALLALTIMGCSEKPPAEPPTTPTPPMRTPPAPDAGPAATEPAPSTAADSGAIELFNGRNLDGWTYDLSDANVKPEDVWSVENGVLRCTGKPSGVLRTEREDFHDYVLTLEWRWPPGTSGGNNGVLVHASTPRELGIWPRSVEVQLAKDNAGDFWVIGTELDVENEESRKEGRRHLNLTDGSEKPLGEWNQMEITCRGDEVIVKVNGTLVNHATNCNVTRGAICLQSEGAPIEYRNVRLVSLGGAGAAPTTNSQ